MTVTAVFFWHAEHRKEEACNGEIRPAVLHATPVQDCMRYPLLPIMVSDLDEEVIQSVQMCGHFLSAFLIFDSFEILASHSLILLRRRRERRMMDDNEMCSTRRCFSGCRSHD